jgi:hypothetical protein
MEPNIALEDARVRGYARSITAAIPCPPPMQSDARP